MVGKLSVGLMRRAELVKIWTHVGNIHLPVACADPQAVEKPALSNAFSFIFRICVQYASNVYSSIMLNGKRLTKQLLNPMDLSSSLERASRR